MRADAKLLKKTEREKNMMKRVRWEETVHSKVEGQSLQHRAIIHWHEVWVENLKYWILKFMCMHGQNKVKKKAQNSFCILSVLTCKQRSTYVGGCAVQRSQQQVNPYFDHNSDCLNDCKYNYSSKHKICNHEINWINWLLAV